MLQCVVVWVVKHGTKIQHRVIWNQVCAAVCCSILQGVAECCSVLQCVLSNELRFASCHLESGVYYSMLQRAVLCCSVLQCVAVCCSVLQCAAVYCSVLQCDAV